MLGWISGDNLGNLDAIGYHSPNGRITGALLDATDAFAAFHEQGLSVPFYCIGIARRELLTLIRGRYTCAEALLPKLFTLWTRLQLVGRSFRRFLVPYSAYRRLQLCLKAEQVYILPTQYLRYDHNKGRIKDAPNATFLLDPQQHPYAVGKQLEYRKKVYLDALPQLTDAANNVLVTLVSAHKAHDAKTLNRALEACQPYDKALALSYDRKAGGPQVTVLRPPVADFFGQFNTYLYLPSKGDYDENPRILIESVWLNKRIVIGGELAENDPVKRKLAALRDDCRPFALNADDLLISLFAD